MKKFFKPLFIAASLVLSMASLTSCDSEGNEIIRVDPDDPNTSDPITGDTTYDLIVNPTNASNRKERNIIVTKAAGGYVTVNANFKGNENMYRLYMTRHFIGSDEGAQPYEYELGEKKADGSIDLQQQDKKEFTFKFDFKAPDTNDQVVQYVLWVTTGRGDFRDINKRNAVGTNAVGVITIKAGDSDFVSSDVTAGVKSFSAILLNAPLADGTSKSFISIFDGQKYAINNGDETAALWDFGYYYGQTNKTSIVSVATFPKAVVDVAKVSGVTALNNFYITRSSLDFDTASAADLVNISRPSTQRVTKLQIGEVLEFQDAYGNKGLIKITNKNDSVGTDGFIQFDVKVLENVVSIQG